ncbi:unnamed protein product [Didymodactylos carnosus]|uniref:Uncharacterized protein n=1 Tax=Didymodactylos carnosus TaxID=1234261 RepID=A0A8S2IRM6_9BILA|nr:unnamed protein product [Didymodactylos carnosus]
MYLVCNFLLILAYYRFSCFAIQAYFAIAKDSYFVPNKSYGIVLGEYNLCTSPTRCALLCLNTIDCQTITCNFYTKLCSTSTTTIGNTYMSAGSITFVMVLGIVSSFITTTSPSIDASSIVDRSTTILDSLEISTSFRTTSIDSSETQDFSASDTSILTNFSASDTSILTSDTSTAAEITSTSGSTTTSIDSSETQDFSASDTSILTSDTSTAAEITSTGGSTTKDLLTGEITTAENFLRKYDDVATTASSSLSAPAFYLDTNFPITYTDYTFVYRADTSSTTIAFEFGGAGNGSCYLDDVHAIDAFEDDYIDNPRFDITSGWIVSGSGAIEQNTYPHTLSGCYNGASQSDLRQIIPTSPPQTFNVSFYLACPYSIQLPFFFKVTMGPT